jgi:hypothetical protein
MLLLLETKNSLRLGSESDTFRLTSFADLNWSVLFQYKRRTYSTELTAGSNDLAIVGSIVEKLVQKVD